MLYPDRKLHPNLFSYFRRLTFRALIVGLALFGACLAPARAFIGVSVNVGIAPPPLRVYVQPAIPGSGYIWTPGYWAWDPDDQDYYWVPGTWVLAPRVGYLWTPPWWGWNNGFYVFHRGYWGPHIGFYGGIPYGYGYTGDGYEGGYWNGGRFFYNRTVNNVTNISTTNVYSKNVVMNRTTNVSYNGGAGGIAARPSAAQLRAARESHLAPTAVQTRHAQAALKNPGARNSANGGHPSVKASSKLATSGKSTGVTSAHGKRSKTKSQPLAGTEEPAAHKTKQAATKSENHKPKSQAKVAHKPALAAKEHKPAPQAKKGKTPEKTKGKKDKKDQ